MCLIGAGGKRWVELLLARLLRQEIAKPIIFEARRRTMGFAKKRVKDALFCSTHPTTARTHRPWKFSQRQFPGGAPGLNAGLFKVELVFDPPPRFVGNLAFAQELVNEFALGGDELEPQGRAELRIFLSIRAIARAELAAGLVARSERRGHRVWQLVLFREFFEHAQSGVHGGKTGGELRLVLALAFFGSLLCDAQPADHCRQRQTETHQGEEDNSKSDEQDQVAMRKWLSVGDGQRNGERSGQRDDATDARIAKHEYPLPRRLRVALAQRWAQP